MPSIASQHAALGTAFLLALHSMRWARARGLRHYNWQPSPPGGGVLRFKRQWGSADLRYAYLTRVTGDVSPILAAGVVAVKAGYPFHYVLPYDRIGPGAGAGPSTRKAAWQAAQERRAASRRRAELEGDRSVVEHYEKQLARFGPTAQGMDWKDEASQELRFRVLCEVCDLGGRSLHDVGCGAGHLYGFLRRQGVAVGLHRERRLPAHARVRPPPASRSPLRSAGTSDRLVRGDLGRRGLLGALQREARPLGRSWWRFVREALRRMYAMCRVAIAFNLMSDRVDWRAKDLFYAPRGAVLDFCRAELSPWVILRHDYPLHEYTVYVHRESPVTSG